jgi:hypothetical protein
MTDAAARQRAYRDRIRSGRVVVTLELDAGIVAKLEAASPELAACDVDDSQYRALLSAAAQDLLSN